LADVRRAAGNTTAALGRCHGGRCHMGRRGYSS
jgi:hypothetical protein